MYECGYCGYTSDRYRNLLRHKNRKNSCNKTVNNSNENINRNISNTESQNDNDRKCPKCKIMLSSAFSLKRHLLTCYGVDYKTCPTCFKVFSSVSGKNNHIRNVKCTPPPPTEQIISTINNITNNNITNNTTNNITNNIQINVFGKEDFDYLLKDTKIILKLKSFGKGGVYAFAKILDDVHFNKDKPENTTLIKPDEFGNGVMIMNEYKEWEYRDFEDVRDDLLQNIVKYFRAYNEVKKKQDIKLVEKKEKEIIKNCAYELIALEGSIPVDLFDELDMNDDDIEEDEEEIRKKLRKFDKSTMKNIHHRTFLNFKKENGSYVRK
tara:strand:- start:1266 stop:2234 length:969 start_codon:yes stop_codon:yes gene_type:complete